MQGTFSATQDQISWVITSYIVASAIMIPTGGWLSTSSAASAYSSGRSSGFTVASVLLRRRRLADAWKFWRASSRA